MIVVISSATARASRPTQPTHIRYLEGWQWDNCDLASPGRLASMFAAEAVVVAQAGMGLTQNAVSKGGGGGVGHP